MVRKLLIWFGLGALAFIAIRNLGHFQELLRLLHHLSLPILAMLIVIQLGSYWANAKYYQSFLAIFGYRVHLKRLYETALAINFVNQVLPSGGISGASFLARTLAEDDVPAGKATLAQVVRYGFTFLSFLAVLTFGFLLLFLTGGANHISARLTLLVLLIIIGVSLFSLAIINDRARLERVVGWLISLINAVANAFRRKKRRRAVISKQQLQLFFQEFYEGYEFLKEERGHWLRPLAFCLLGNMAEVATIYVVFAAFGYWVNPGVVIAGYTLANFLSLAAVFTSGVGVYEAVMVATFVALGTPLALSVSVVVVYRFLNLGVFLPIGFYFYRQGLVKLSSSRD